MGKRSMLVCDISRTALYHFIETRVLKAQ